MISIRSFFVWFLPLAVTGSLASAQILLEPTVCQFGKVHNSKIYQKKVRVKNASKFNLRLFQPESDCGFLESKFTKSDLKPGESTDLNLIFKPKTTQKGLSTYHVKFSATVERAHGGTAKSWELKVQADLSPDYYFDPEKLSFLAPNGENNKTKITGKIYLSTETYKKYDLLSATTDKKGFKVIAIKDKTANAVDVQLTMTEPVSIGVTRGMIVLKVSGENTSDICYPFEITKRSDVLVEPASLFIGDLQDSGVKNRKWQTLIRPLTSRNINIDKIENVPNWLNFKIERNKNELMITWNVVESKTKGSNVQTEIVPDFLQITFKGSSNERISIPFKAFWGNAKPKPFLPALQRTPIHGGPPSYYGPTAKPTVQAGGVTPSAK